MGKIAVLDNRTAELIAAGEVVERPLSVVKELVENSVDAGASHVTVEIKGGGVEYIRITDDGCGMSAEDVKLAFLRHATSKIRTADDLDCICSLGFRGEALASIAAVSRVEAFTRENGRDSGAHISLAGGELLSVGEAGCGEGTTFIVRNLFYNTHARMKFLKKNSAEGAAIGALIDKLALCWPQVSFRFISEGREELFSPGDNTLAGAVYAVYGRDTADGLSGVEYTLGNVTVKGYISKPLAAKGSRKFQHFYLNDRLISSAILTAALEEAYKNSIMTGRFPMCVLQIRINPSLVDVNVHPSKAQVKFADDRQIFDAVYWAVKNSLNQDGGRAKPETIPVKKQVPEAYGFLDRHAEQQKLEAAPAQEKPEENIPPPAFYEQKPEEKTGYPAFRSEEKREAVPVVPFLPQSEQAEMLESPIFPVLEVKKAETAAYTPAEPVNTGRAEPFRAAPASGDAEFKVIGEVFSTYIIVQQDGEVLLIDKHAAHERMIFERLKAGRRGASQILLTSQTVRLDKAEKTMLLDNAQKLAEYGFLLEDFGGGAVVVREIPSLLTEEDIPAVIEETAAALTEARGRISPECEELIFHSIACKAAVKAGKTSSPAEQEALVRELLKNPDIKYCPHGRPVTAVLSKTWFDKQFKRIP